MVEVRTKIGRRVAARPPTTVHRRRRARRGAPHAQARRRARRRRLAAARARRARRASRRQLAPVMGVLDEGAVAGDAVLVRPARREIDALRTVEHPRGAARLDDVRRSGTLRLTEAARRAWTASGATIGNRRQRRVEPAEPADRRALLARRRPLHRGGPLHRRDEQRDRSGPSTPSARTHLVDEVVSYWQRHGVKVRVHRSPRRSVVTVSSRMLTAWWTQTARPRPHAATRSASPISPGSRRSSASGAALRALGGRRLVVARQRRPERDPRVGHDQRRARRGRRAAAGDVGLVCSWRRGRTAKSTKETHWLRVSGADQVERGDVPRARARPAGSRGRARPAEQADRADRIPPLRRRHAVGARGRRAARALRGPVYSLEVPGSHTVVTTGRARRCTSVFPRMSRRSSSSRATRATTSSCSTR